MLIASLPLLSQSENIENSNDLFFAVYKDNQIGIVNTLQELIIPIEYHTIQSTSAENNLLIISKQEPSSKNVKWGAVDFNNRVVIPFKFKRLNNWQSKNYIVGIITNSDGKEIQKVFDYSGTEVFPSNIENAWYFNDTIAKVKNAEFEYLINIKGEQVTKKYDRIFGMVNGMIKFQEGELAGFLDSTYIEVIPAKYDWFPTGFFKENGLANVRHKDEWTEAEIRKDGSEAFNIGINYRYADHYRKGNYLLAYEVDPNEENSSFEHCLFKFDTGEMIYNFGPSMAGAGYQVFENTITFWGRPMYQDYFELTQINHKGELINKIQIPIVETTTNDALILIDRNRHQNKYGILPMNDSGGVEMKFDSIYVLRNFEDEIFTLVGKIDDHFGVIDSNGSAITEFKFDKIDLLESGDLLTSLNGKTSIFTIEGHLKMENSKYELKNSIKENQNWYVVISKEKYGVYDFGEDLWIITPEFSNIKKINRKPSR